MGEPAIQLRVPRHHSLVAVPPAPDEDPAMSGALAQAMARFLRDPSPS